MFGYVSKKRFDELERRVMYLEGITMEHNIYPEMSAAEYVHDYPWDMPKPIVSISLWQAIHALIAHLGLQINGIRSTPARFILEKVKK